MLASDVTNLQLLRFPKLMSIKLDGVRASVQNGQLLSRNLKPIRNPHVQALFGRPELEGLDGELLCGDITSATCFQTSVSAVMNSNGCPKVYFHVFDKFSTETFAA